MYKNPEHTIPIPMVPMVNKRLLHKHNLLDPICSSHTEITMCQSIYLFLDKINSMVFGFLSFAESLLRSERISLCDEQTTLWVRFDRFDG